MFKPNPVGRLGMPNTRAARIPDHLWLEVGAHISGQQVGVHLVARRHVEPPPVPHLAAQVEVHVGDGEAVSAAGEGGRAGGVGGGKVGAAIKVAKVAVGGGAVAAGEGIGEGLQGRGKADAADFRSRCLAAASAGERKRGLGRRHLPFRI